MAIARHRGFTLVELLVVLAIMGLAYAVVPPLISGARTSAELKGTARQLAAGLRKARNFAVTQRIEATLTLDVNRRVFNVTGDTRTYALPAAIDFKIVAAQQDVREGETGAIRFYPDGSSSGGRLTLSAGGAKYDVDVNWLTGRVAIVD